jgi:hypothetical protein
MDKEKPVTDWESGLPETPCGRGSMLENTEEIRAWLPDVIERYDVKSIADIGCGDQNWIHHCLPDGIEYDGYDLKPRRQDVTTFDVSSEVLPWKYDLVLCIYVLNHLKPDMAERAIRMLKESGAKYILMSYSDGDQYAIHGMNYMESKLHKDTGRHVWKYGIWELL